MVTRRHGFDGTIPAAHYSEQQVGAVLSEIGVKVSTDSVNDFICFCPFHGNYHTPSFSVSKTNGSFLCFNDSCGQSGNLVQLVKRLTKKNDFEAMRLIAKAEEEAPDFLDTFSAIFDEEEPTEQMSQEKIDAMVEDFWTHPKAIDYMHGRGFTDETLKQYSVGYSAKRDAIAVPMHSEKGEIVGVVGRKIDVKKFDNSRKLPVRRTLWNLHRARRKGDTVIVCESTFDAMRISQAGFPNVVACLGGNFNERHALQLGKYFNRVVIMTDWDDSTKHNYDKPSEGKFCRKCRTAGYTACRGHNPGRDTGQKIAKLMKHKEILWAAWDFKRPYPDDAKDAGDCTNEQIRACINGAVTNMEYQDWDIYYQKDLAPMDSSMV